MFFRTAFICSAFLLLTVASPLAKGSVEQDNLWSQYGSGVPSSNGLVPEIGVRSMPVIGNRRFEVFVTGLPEAGQVELFTSFAQGEFGLKVFGSTFTLLLSPPFWRFRMQRESALTASVTLPLPDDPSLIGKELFLQAVLLEAGRVASSAGLRVLLSEASMEPGTVAALLGDGADLHPKYLTRLGMHSALAMPPSLQVLAIEESGFSIGGGRVVDASNNSIQTRNLQGEVPYIRLRDLGRLYRYSDGQTQGFFVALDDAAVMFSVLGSSNGTGGEYSKIVGVSESGRRFVAVKAEDGGSRVLLSTTDGTRLANGSTLVDITPQGGRVDVDPRTLVLTEDSVLFCAQAHEGGSTGLCRAPIDGSDRASLLSLPPLGNGGLPEWIDPSFLSSEDGILAFRAGDSFAADVYAFAEAEDAVVNVSAFPAGTAVAEPLGSASDGTPFRGALSQGGSLIAFVALESGIPELFVAPTDGSLAGALGELTTDDWFSPYWQEIRDLYLISAHDLYFFAGPNPNQLDLFHAKLDDSSAPVIYEAQNVTATSTDYSPPFLIGGTVIPGASFQRHNFLYFERIHVEDSKLRDLVAVEVFHGIPYSVTGTEFTNASLPSYEEMDSLTLTRSSRVFSEKCVMIAHAKAEPRDMSFAAAFDAVRPQEPLRWKKIALDGTRFQQVQSSEAGDTFAFSSYKEGTTTLWYLDWATEDARPAHQFVGSLQKGTLKIVHEPDPTLVFSTADPAGETHLQHVSLRSGWCTTLAGGFSKVVVTSTSSFPPLGPASCAYSSGVDTSCTGLEKEDGITVTINATMQDPNIKIPVEIVVVPGVDGPTFRDGSRRIDLDCVTTSVTLPTKSGKVPGCYSVKVGENPFEKRINAITATPTFRNVGTFSADNEFPWKDKIPDKLGTNTEAYGPCSFTNTMELGYAIEPIDGCACSFDIRRTLHRITYSNGKRKNERSGDDDPDNCDEDLVPSAGGRIYSADAPGLADFPGGADGETWEYHGHFWEWVEIRNRGELERLTGDLEWESHLCIRNNKGTWQFEPGGHIDLGHEENLDSKK